MFKKSILFRFLLGNLFLVLVMSLAFVFILYKLYHVRGFGKSIDQSGALRVVSFRALKNALIYFQNVCIESRKDVETLKETEFSKKRVEEAFSALKEGKGGAKPVSHLKNERASTLLNTLEKDYSEFFSLLDNLTSSCNESLISKANNLSEKILSQARELTSLLAKESERAINAIIISFVIAFLLVISLIVFLYYKLRQAMISSISQMEKRLSSLERLDFTETIQEGEVFKEFEKSFISILGLQRALESLFISVKNASSSITSSIEKEKESMESLAQVGEGINSLIAKVNQSGSEVTELLSLIEKSTEEMKLAISEISKNTTNTASKAKALRTTAEEMEGSVLNLERAMQQIRDISDTIKGIAEQTNLLALNASIEAARAGEAGKGFAVVANEVKELAKKVSDFIGEIEKIVDELQVMVAETVNKTKESTKMVDEVEEATSMIAGAVEEQTAVVANIAENTMQSKEKSFSLISEIEDLTRVQKS